MRTTGPPCDALAPLYLAPAGAQGLSLLPPAALARRRASHRWVRSYSLIWPVTLATEVLGPEILGGCPKGGVRQLAAPAQESVQLRTGLPKGLFLEQLFAKGCWHLPALAQQSWSAPTCFA